jgi:hypothetical protein
LRPIDCVLTEEVPILFPGFAFGTLKEIDALDLAVEEVLGPLGRRLEDEPVLEPPAPPLHAAKDNDVIIASEVRVKIFFILFFP